MSIVIKAATGLVAGVVAGALGLAFFPRVEPDSVKPRMAVEKPRFVVAAAHGVAPATPAASAIPAAAPSRAAEAAAPPPKPEPPAPAPAALARSEPPKAVAPDASAKAQPAIAPAPLAKAEPAKAAPSPSPSSVEVRAVAPAPRASAAPEPSEAAARWSVQGLMALAKGDLSSARAFLTRAAEAGDARAWVALADTYDPATLSKFGVVGAPGDAQRAKDCLVKAAAAGIVVKDRMAALDQDPQSLR